MERPCPVCGAAAQFDANNRFRPFCSERCKLVDLSKWLGGDYAIPGEPANVPTRRPDDETSQTSGFNA